MRCGQPSYPGCCTYADSLDEDNPQKIKDDVYEALKTYPFVKEIEKKENLEPAIRTFVERTIEKELSHEGLVFVDPPEDED